MGLHFNRVGKVKGSMHHFVHSDILSMLDISRKDARLQPFQPPGIFHGDNGVRTGNHALHNERPIEIALVSPEQFNMRNGVLRHQRDHNARN